MNSKPSHSNSRALRGQCSRGAGCDCKANGMVSIQHREKQSNSFHYNKDYNGLFSKVTSGNPVNTIHYNKDYNTQYGNLAQRSPVNAIHYNKDYNYSEYP